MHAVAGRPASAGQPIAMLVAHALPVDDACHCSDDDHLEMMPAPFVC
jgi:hypothetical protein